MNDDTPIETSEADARPWRGDVPAAEPSTPAAPIIGWHIRMRGCDGSADWIELGPERPTDVPAEADVLAVVHAGASAMAAQPATEQAGSRTDGMGVPLSCGKPLCSPGGHHSLCHLASQPATAPVAPAGHVVVPSPITESMHVAACKVLTRAAGLDGTPQRMLDALVAAAPAAQQGEAVAPTRADLIAALKFYANREHLIWSDESAWDTVSGEPQNWWCDEAGTATVEDGTIAARTLAGELTARDIEELEDGEDAGITPAGGQA